MNENRVMDLLWLVAIGSSVLLGALIWAVPHLGLGPRMTLVSQVTIAIASIGLLAAAIVMAVQQRRDR